MGKSPVNKRLELWVDDDMLDEPAIVELIEKGHVVRGITTEFAVKYGTMPDVIFSCSAHQWTPEMFNVKGLLDVAIKAARKRKGDTK